MQGLATASWRYVQDAHVLQLRVRHDDGLRRRSRAAALDQDVIGDAAAALVGVDPRHEWIVHFAALGVIG